MTTWRLIIGAAALTLAIALPVQVNANMGGTEEEESSNPDAVAGKKAVEDKDWKRGVELLSKAATAEPENAQIQNWLGFAQRKQGNLDAAFAAYNKALKLNPQLKAAHEYIGEAYLLSGNVAKAEQHLAELKKICSPIPCEEYKDLRRAVDDYKKKNKQ